MISAGDAHSLAITSEGGVFAWGKGCFGQLGDGGEESRYPPVPVSGLGAGVRAVEAGHDCSYAIRDDGALMSWGWNYQGVLGDGTTTDRLTPEPVPGLVAGVAATSGQLALLDDGSVVAWGGEFPADERGRDARLDLAASKLGGRPDLRRGARWPTSGGRPLSFVAQVDLAQVAPLDRAGLLPRAGLLSFFYCGFDPSVHNGAVIYSEPGTPLTRRDFPAALADNERYAALSLTPQEQLTLPTDPPAWLTGEERQAYGEELYTFEGEPNHRLLGHPDLVQNDPRDGRLLLLQVDTDDGARMVWGDAGRLFYVIYAEDLRASRFEAAICRLQSH